ncbi:MAG: hypothetical protein LBV41_06245, partial [Cytophagaceae bacterium]|nr:hypothetical protein [Cytophagaceae bacterium]
MIRATAAAMVDAAAVVAVAVKTFFSLIFDGRRTPTSSSSFFSLEPQSMNLYSNKNGLQITEDSSFNCSVLFIDKGINPLVAFIRKSIL